MELKFDVFDTGNLIALLALTVATISLCLNISDRIQRHMSFRIADVRAYTMRIDTVDSHLLLSFCLLNASSRPLYLNNAHIHLKGYVSLPHLTAIECARLKQLIEPSAQANRIVADHATSLPVAVPAHGAAQISILFCLKHRQHSADLHAFRCLPPSRLYTLSRIASRFRGEPLASFDLVLSAHGRKRVFRFCPGSIAFSDASDIDDGLTTQKF